MPSDKQVEAVIAQLVKTLANARAQDWSIQDKGDLIAAIHLQLMARPSTDD